MASTRVGMGWRNKRTAVTDDVENLILEHLRAIRSDIGGIKDDVREIRQRLTSLEATVAGLRRDSAKTPTCMAT